MIFEKLKKIVIAYIANNFKLSNKLTKVNNHLGLKLKEIEKAQQVLAQKLQNLEKQMHLKLYSLDSKMQVLLRKSMENEIFALRNSVLPYANLPIRPSHFFLLSYNKHIPKYSHHNLGDFIQTIATKNALLFLNPKTTFEFFDRDSLISYYPVRGGGGNNFLNALTPVVMQGWFAFPDSPHFIPNHYLLPIFVGTHFTSAIQKFLQYFIVYYPWYFEGKTIGCRDLATLGFCEKLGLEAYLSRCLTLTLPKRTQEQETQATKVFLVGIPEDLLKFIPRGLCEGAISVNQQGVSNEQSLQWQSFYHCSEDLLETYKNEARLVITCALHCASPCLAMGIPVVLIARNEENLGRFSALSGIVPIYTIEDLEKGRVDFVSQSLDIESLKQDMLENLNLSIKEAMGESVDKETLQAIRQRIADFVPAMQSNMAESHENSAIAGGGIS